MMNTQNLKQLYQGTFILNLAMILGPGLIAGIAYYLNNFASDGQPFIGDTSLKIPLQYAVLGVAIFAFVAGRYLVQRQLNTVKKEDNLEKKMEIYRGANILRTSLLEGATLLALISYLLTAWQGFLFFSVLMIIYMVANMATISRISKELALSAEEQNDLIKAKSS